MLTRGISAVLSCMITVVRTKQFFVQSFSPIATFQRLPKQHPHHRTIVFSFRAMSSKDSDTTTTTTTVSSFINSKNGLERRPPEDDHDSQQQPLILSLRHELQRIDKIPSQPDKTTKNPTIRLILASASPRRREILDMMGLQGRYQVIPSPCNETALQQELMTAGADKGGGKTTSSVPPLPIDYARILAQEKARALAESSSVIKQQQPSSSSTVLILASDTIVDLDGAILEKPKDATEAFDMLSRLSGAEHCVHTGVAIYRVVIVPKSKKNDDDEPLLVAEPVVSFTDTARVRFATLGRAEIQAYIETNEPMDKAGSYGIQGMGGQFVANVEGDFFTVMGLPMHRTSRALAQAVLLSLSSLQTTTGTTTTPS